MSWCWQGGGGGAVGGAPTAKEENNEREQNKCMTANDRDHSVGNARLLPAVLRWWESGRVPASFAKCIEAPPIANHWWQEHRGLQEGSKETFLLLRCLSDLVWGVRSVRLRWNDLDIFWFFFLASRHWLSRKLYILYLHKNFICAHLASVFCISRHKKIIENENMHFIETVFFFFQFKSNMQTHWQSTRKEQIEENQ